jgi:nucleoid DNA-binding protein
LKVSRIQILTIEELLHGEEVKMPPQFGTFKQAQKVDKQAEQPELGFGKYSLPPVTTSTGEPQYKL